MLPKHLGRVVRVEGVEPSRPVWKTGVLAVEHQTRVELPRGIEPRRDRYQRPPLTRDYESNKWSCRELNSDALPCKGRPCPNRQPRVDSRSPANRTLSYGFGIRLATMARDLGVRRCRAV